uniref:Uncharacterized protein n=1 Tax=Trypanosoma cruzi TaxID=5693 RepID=Q86M60_TRYCR|nr:unknown [Trypanosoma cruzi]
MADVPHERCVQRLLVSDGEMPHPFLRLGGLLLCVLAVVCSKVRGTKQPLVPYYSVWRLRVHMRHQLVLQHRAHSVFLHLSACVDAALSLPDENLSVEHLLEVGHVHNYYHRRDIAAETFWRAVRKSGLSVSESAMMGVRTRWQGHQLVQMVMNAQSAFAIYAAISDRMRRGLLWAKKDGHDLLDRPARDPMRATPPLQSLHPVDKAIILALCLDIRNTNPYHGLTQHHMQTYVERLLVDPAPAPFMIQSQMLLIRSRLERRRNRVQERAFMQITELVDQFSAARDPTRETLHRTESDYFYSVAYPSIWHLKSEYADFCYEERLFKTALDAYEQVLDWENIIKCCKALDKRKRAESLARELLETDPCNPFLWVALGEATRDASHLWKAWDLSNHRSAALCVPWRSWHSSERSIAKWWSTLMSRAVESCVWRRLVSLGYAAMRLEQWGRSGEAFTRVCQIQPNDAYAWNNLASVLLRDGRLRPAFNAMSQALRNNRRDWRMWQNYFSIGCELKEVTETTNALNVLLEIAKRNTQLERESLHRFVDNAIAYMEGRIPASSKDQMEGVEESHLFASLMEDEEEQNMCDIVPIAGDVEMPEAFLESGRRAASVKEAEGVREGIVSGTSKRMRETFKRNHRSFCDRPGTFTPVERKLLSLHDGPLRGVRDAD